MRYLVDTSALVRILRRQVDPVWFDVANRGLISVCTPVLLETLCIADAKGYADLEQDVHNACLAIAVPDGAWELAAVVHRGLVERGLVTVCEPALIEALKTAETRDAAPSVQGGAQVAGAA